MSALTDRPAHHHASAKGNRRAQPTPTQRHIAREAGIVLDELAFASPIQPGIRETVTVRRRLDLLQAEFGTGRITQAQFLAGRMIQLVFERGAGARLGTASWDKVGAGDTSVARELAMILALDDAERVRRFTAKLEKTIGVTGVRFLRAILVEGHSFKSYAATIGRSGELAVRSVAERFRWHLSDLTEAQHTATGPEHAPIRGGAC